MALTRRNFLTTSAAALGGVLASPLLRAQSIASKRPVSGSHEVMLAGSPKLDTLEC
jgi:hypothetical protein